MQKKFKRVLVILLVIIFFLLGVGTSYIVYRNYKGKSYVLTTNSLSINYSHGKRVRIHKTKKMNFSVINFTDSDVYYYIELDNLKNIKGEVNYILTSDNLNLADTISGNTIISSYIRIKGGETHNYELSFSCSVDNIFSLDVNVAEDRLSNTFADVILANNEVKDEPLTTIGSAALEDEGLIKGTDSSGTTYYFRGSVTNNNVLIDGNKFKIVRITGDGSVKLVLDGALEEIRKFYDEGNYNFTSTALIEYLNDTWFNSLPSANSFVSSSKYCNDISKDGDDFVSYSRLYTDNIVSFVCLGDKVLSKVGLLTADEAIFAGASVTDTNRKFYLYNADIKANAFLLTGAKMKGEVYYPFSLNTDGKVASIDPGNVLRAIRPVITINKTVNVSGTGTVEDPYILTNN